jgi:CheY-like chemotaxis protein
MEKKTLRVAMLEDDTDDRYLTKEVIKEIGLDLQLSFYHNSNDLLKALQEDLPNLVLIDDNATPENSVQILRHIRQNQHLSHLPVIVLSDSHLPKHRETCYREGASSFVIKPTSLEGTKTTITSFFRYWTEVAEC